MKLMTVFGTRPEIIRLSRVIPQMDAFVDEQILVHTGQNYDPNLSDIFFKDLQVRSPDVYMGVRATSFAEQIGLILAGIGDLFAEHKPDKVLILGDTNSGLVAMVAARMGIPVYHMEAGNRCYDNRVPEEVNRRIIDHSSDVLMPYTYRSMENLLREGIARQRIFVTGNPIYEVLQYFSDQIDASDVLTRFDVAAQGYMLVTMHRAENVDVVDRLRGLIGALEALGARYQMPLIVSLHPRTADKMQQADIKLQTEWVRLMQPMGFFDFVHLEKNAFCVISDSGTVQEECSIFQVPSVTIRDVTERAETIEVGSNILTGASREDILRAVRVAVETPTNWNPPEEYMKADVSATVARVVLGYRHQT